LPSITRWYIQFSDEDIRDQQGCIPDDDASQPDPPWALQQVRVVRIIITKLRLPT